METALNNPFLQVFAQASGQGAQGMGPMIFIWVLIFGAMWFFMIAPQRKKQKQHEKMLTSLSSGDKVITAGGIHGTITNVKDDRFVVRIAEGVKIELQKSSVLTVIESDSVSDSK